MGMGHQTPMRRIAAMGLALALWTGATQAAVLEDCQKGDLISRIVACDDIIADGKADAATRAAALVSRGYAVYAQTGDTGEPLANFTSATLLDPASAAAFIGLGSMHFARKEMDQAKAAFSAALKLVPEDTTALSLLGRVAAALGDQEEAIAYFDKALAIDKRLPGANLYKADALVKVGRKGEALALYRFTLYLFDRRAQQYAYATRRISTLEAELGQ